MRRVFTLLIIIGGVALAWHYRDSLVGAWREFAGREAAAAGPSAALAESAQAKLGKLSGPKPEGSVALTETEVQSLVQYRVAGFLPSYVVAPHVELRDGRIRVSAQVPTNRFPRVEELGDVIGFLPDTTEVTAVGQLIPLDGDRVGFAIDEISAARVPLPRGLIPAVLQRLGRKDEPGLPADALALPLPAGAKGAYVRGDSLVLIGSAPRS